MTSLKLVLLVALLGTGAEASPSLLVQQGNLPEVLAADTASLKESLEAGLRARRPSEFAFIARVVAFVEAGHLTRQIVTETFHWAREKQPFPYPYFERAMKQRAAKVGVEL